MEIPTELTLVGVDEEEAQPDAPDPRMIPVSQALYIEQGDAFGRGEEPVGWAHGFAVRIKKDSLAKCQLTFVFDGGDGDSLEIHGLLPREGSNFGGGSLAVTGGTGRFYKAAGRVEVETRNPKRYRIFL